MAEHIDDRKLTALLKKNVKVFLLSGVALDGQLLEFDADVLVLSPNTVVYKKHITTFYEDKHERQNRQESALR